MTPQESAEAYAHITYVDNVEPEYFDGCIFEDIVDNFLAGFAHAQSDPETISRFLHEKRMEQSQNTIEALQIGIDQLQKQLDAEKKFHSESVRFGSKMLSEGIVRLQIELQKSEKQIAYHAKFTEKLLAERDTEIRILKLFCDKECLDAANKAVKFAIEWLK